MITGFYMGILAIIFVALSFNVILRRIKTKTLFGDNNDPAITAAIRIHGNFAEYVPLVLLMLYAYEGSGGSRYVVHAFGILLIIGRALHIAGLWRKIVAARIGGTVITQLLLVMLAVMLITRGIQYMSVIAGPPPI